VACDSSPRMSRPVALAYTLSALATVIGSLLTMLVLMLPTTRGDPSLLLALLLGTGPGVTIFVVSIVLPIALLLRRLAWFGPWPMAGAAFIAAAVWMGVVRYGSPMLMSDGTVAPMTWFGLLYGSVMYGVAGALCALLFWFVFRAIVGPERLLAGSSIQA